MIPYKFAIVPEFAGFVILGYMTPSKKFIKEYIKVKPRGFSFHNVTQPTLNHLISFFKQNYSTIEYWKYVSKQKEPKIINTNEIWKQKEEE